MKTAVSIPDAVFDDAERLARRLHKSRSQVYREALAEYLARHAPSTVTETLDLLCDELGQEREPFREAVARRTLERSAW